MSKEYEHYLEACTHLDEKPVDESTYYKHISEMEQMR